MEYDSDTGDDVFTLPSIVVWEPGYFTICAATAKQHSGEPLNSPELLDLALAGPSQLNLKMGSIPGASPGVDINYNKQGSDGAGSPFSPIGSPSSPCTSWEESMMQLSRDLQIICRSPDRYDMPVFPTSSGNALPPSGPTSPTTIKMTTSSTSTSISSSIPSTAPTTTTPPLTPGPSGKQERGVTMRHAVAGADLGRLLNIRHVQSEEKLREKLTYICRSPRRSRSSTSSSDGETKLKPGNKMAATAGNARSNYKRRAIHASFPYFKTSVDIGDHTIEDLCVFIEDHKLKVFSERKDSESCCANTPAIADLPATINLPMEVNPQKLICIVKEGVLEVKESRRKCPPPNKVLGRQLSMSYTSTGFKAPDTMLRHGALDCNRHDSDQCPIVIEDDGSHLLKLVLRVPPGYKFNDLQIKTVDNQLIVTGRRGPQRSLSASFVPPEWNKENQLDEDSFVKVFELPSSVDPFSITARLTEQHQLIIQATLSHRARSNTM